MLQQADATTATAAVSATSIVVGGIATGLTYETLLAGFAGGLVSLSFIQPMGLWRRIWTPVTATLAAGYTAPVAVGYLARFVGDEVAPLSLRVFAAFGVGVVAQAAIPAAIQWTRQRFGLKGAQR